MTEMQSFIFRDRIGLRSHVPNWLRSLETPSDEFQDWLKSYTQPSKRIVVQQITPRVVKVEFQIDKHCKNTFCLKQYDIFPESDEGVAEFRNLLRFDQIDKGPQTASPKPIRLIPSSRILVTQYLPGWPIHARSLRMSGEPQRSHRPT